MTIHKLTFELRLEVGEEFYKAMVGSDIQLRQRVMDNLVRRMQEQLCSEEGNITAVNKLTCLMTKDTSSIYEANRNKFELFSPFMQFKS